MKNPLEVIRLYQPHDYSLNGAFKSRLESAPDRPFILFEDVTISWREFDGKVQACAGVLASRGIAHGDRVAVMYCGSVVESGPVGIEALQAYDVVLSGAAATPQPLVNTLRDHNVKVVISYGMSETCGEIGRAHV